MALDQYLWNEGQQSYDAYTISGGFDYERYRNSTNLTLCQYEVAESSKNDCIHGDPEATSALMSDVQLLCPGNQAVIYIHGNNNAVLFLC